MSHPTVITTVEDMGKDHDAQVLIWSNKLLEKQVTQLNSVWSLQWKWLLHMNILLLRIFKV